MSSHAACGAMRRPLVAVEQKSGAGIEAGEGGPVPARSLVGPRLGGQNFAAVVGAQKKQGLLVERRHGDHLDRETFRRVACLRQRCASARNPRTHDFPARCANPAGSDNEAPPTPIVVPAGDASGATGMRLIVGSPNRRATLIVARLAIDLRRPGDLGEVPVRQHGDAVAERHRFLVVLRDVENRRAGGLEQGRQFEAHLVAQLGVDVAQRIIEQQDLRIGHQRAGQRGALLLAVGQFARRVSENMPDLEERGDLLHLGANDVLGARCER